MGLVCTYQHYWQRRRDIEEIRTHRGEVLRDTPHQEQAAGDLHRCSSDRAPDPSEESMNDLQDGKALHDSGRFTQPCIRRGRSLINRCQRRRQWRMDRWLGTLRSTMEEREETGKEASSLGLTPNSVGGWFSVEIEEVDYEQCKDVAPADSGQCIIGDKVDFDQRVLRWRPIGQHWTWLSRKKELTLRRSLGGGLWLFGHASQWSGLETKLKKWQTRVRALCSVRMISHDRVVCSLL